MKGSLVRDAGVESPSAARVLTLVLPMPENIANARMHWRVKQRARVEYWLTLDMLWMAKKVPRLDTPMEKASIASVMHLGARMDHDNAMARHKWPLDWMQKRGYIVNDRDLVWPAMPQQIVKRDGDYRLVLTLTEIL